MSTNYTYNKENYVYPMGMNIQILLKFAYYQISESKKNKLQNNTKKMML